VKRAREERLPTLLEAVSYRLRGHSVVDPDRYRSKEELERARQHDPLRAFRDQLVASDILDEATAARLEGEVEHEVTAAIEFADSIPDPNPTNIFADSYATRVPNAPDALPGD